MCLDFATRVAAVTLFLVLAVPDVRCQAEVDCLLPVEEQNRVNYIDTNGRLAIEKQFVWGHPFKEGLAAVANKQGSGFIDVKGVFVIPPNFCYVGDFCEGLAVIEQFNGKWGVIDKRGNVAVQPRYDAINSSSEGIMRWRLGDQIGFVDKSGRQWTPQSDVVSAGNYHEQVSVAIFKDHSYGYIDIDGKIAFNRRFQQAADFQNGLGRVRLHDKVGLVDRKGEFALEPRFEEVRAFAEGLAPAREKDLYGYINVAGEWIILPAFKFAGDFRDGIAPVAKADGWSFIKSDGNAALSGKFDGARGFLGGLAAVKIDNLWGFIDLAGNIRVAPQFDRVEDYSCGLAKCWTKGRESMISQDGKVVWGLVDGISK